MGTGRVTDPDLSAILARLTDTPGDVAEIGVYQGHLFTRLARWAHATGRQAHAFDSFQGMGDPGPQDGPDYPRGVLSSGGPEAFRQRLQDARVPETAYTLHPGFIPDCFQTYTGPGFAFAYVDVDHHDPTAAALAWVWPRILPGGILGMDDWFPGRPLYASPAIAAFLARECPAQIACDNNQLWVRK